MSTSPQATPAEVPDGFEPARNAASALARALESEFVEREREIVSLMVALVAEEHILLLGPPGTGKSALTNALCGALRGRYFQVLLTKFSVPEEVFGPISLQGLENDEYRRVTAGYLPEADVAFIDEIFKANSSILNAMLTALNERAFDDGGKRRAIPLKLAVAASNEFPQDDGLAALYDRFVLRHWVDPIRSRDALRSLLSSGREPTINVSLTPDQLATLRTARDLVTVPDDVVTAVLNLRDELAKEHGITASDRRWRKAMKLIRAAAVLDGRLTADRRDMLVLSAALWDDRDSIPAVYGAVARLVNPDLGKALEYLDTAIEAYAGLKLAEDGSSVQELSQANDTLKKLVDRMNRLDGDTDIERAMARVVRMQHEVATAAAARLGLSGLSF